MDAELSGFVRRRRNNASFFCPASDNNRLADKRRIFYPLDGYEETVEIEMRNIFF